MIARLKWLVGKQESGFWNAFRTTRLIKQAVAGFRKGGAVAGDPSLPKKAATLTMDYLKSIKTLCDEHEWQLTILIIPSRQTVARSGNSHVHHSMLRLSAKLDADVIDPTYILSLGDYARAPDGHWNNEGHRKVGILLADHLLPREKADAAG
jgi:hypothetical protein